MYKTAVDGRSNRLTIMVVFLATVSSPAFGQIPNIAVGGTVNSADYTRTFAPGGIVSIFGSNFAAAAQQPTQFPLPNTLLGVSVELVSNSEQFPLWAVSPTQINAQLPYDTPVGQVQVRVRTAAGVSSPDTIVVSTSAPKLFTQDLTGQGTVVATNMFDRVLTATNPANPADTIVLWMNSLGPTSGNPVAGQSAPGLLPNSLPETISGVTATINGISSPVTFAGLSPGSSGLYQVNVQVPFFTLTGPVAVQVTVGGVASQANTTLPYRQLGFYYSLLGGKAIPGQTLSAMSGVDSSLAFRQSDPLTWGNTGYQAWTDNTGLSSQYATVPGLAITLINGTSIVYDNNGIETGSAGSFYNNSGGGPNSQKPGLTDCYSMSNYFPLVFSGYFELAAATSITQLIGYFDANGVTALPFNPANSYVRYRMNIWSNASGALPKETGSFTGDVFSSDTTAGTFSYSLTGLNLVSSVTTDNTKPIYRLAYVLAGPLTLPAGKYWFSHDASVAAPFTTLAAEPVSIREFQRAIDSQPLSDRNTARVSFFGHTMTFEESFVLRNAAAIRPTVIIENK